MALTELLKKEHWDEYDNKRIRDRRDGKDFACTEQWEVDYLKNLIKKKHPQLDVNTILAAIKNCCETVKAPRPRDPFVECVVKRLGLSAI